MQYTFNVNLMLIELIIYGFDPIEEIELQTSFELEYLFNRLNIGKIQ